MKNKIFATVLFALLASTMFAQTLKVGDKAPEIIQTTINGEEFKLSSLKGKMVLIDFWASWCRPCRKENPNVVEAYNSYKDTKFKNGDGFTVLSVSLDKKKDKWVEAVKKDSLIWPNHVSDLNGWKNSAAVLYNVTSVPASYLINGEGIIVAINPRGSALIKALKQEKKSWFSF